MRMRFVFDTSHNEPHHVCIQIFAGIELAEIALNSEIVKEAKAISKFINQKKMVSARSTNRCNYFSVGEKIWLH